jgi:hypothetical protein
MLEKYNQWQLRQMAPREARKKRDAPHESHDTPEIRERQNYIHTIHGLN